MPGHVGHTGGKAGCGRVLHRLPHSGAGQQLPQAAAGPPAAGQCRSPLPPPLLPQLACGPPCLIALVATAVSLRPFVLTTGGAGRHWRAGGAAAGGALCKGAVAAAGAGERVVVGRHQLASACCQHCLSHFSRQTVCRWPALLSARSQLMSAQFSQASDPAASPELSSARLPVRSWM